MKELSKDWTEIKDEQIDIPDELMPLFNKIGMQLRFHTISGKSEVLTIAHILRKAEEFFHKFYLAEKPIIDFSHIMKDHAEWVKLFGERTPLSPLTHLREEIQEVIDNPSDIMEYADCTTLIFDALRLAGFTLEDLEKAMAAKLQINKRREWIQVGEGETKHWKHKEQHKHEFIEKLGVYECQECGLSYDEFLSEQEENK